MSKPFQGKYGHRCATQPQLFAGQHWRSQWHTLNLEAKNLEAKNLEAKDLEAKDLEAKDLEAKGLQSTNRC